MCINLSTNWAFSPMQVKMKSMFAIGLVFTILLGIFNSMWVFCFLVLIICSDCNFFSTRRDLGCIGVSILVTIRIHNFIMPASFHLLVSNGIKITFSKLNIRNSDWEYPRNFLDPGKKTLDSRWNITGLYPNSNSTKLSMALSGKPGNFFLKCAGTLKILLRCNFPILNFNYTNCRTLNFIMNGMPNYHFWFNFYEISLLFCYLKLFFI